VPATAGIHFFGIVQYIGPERSNDWIAFYDELFGTEVIPDEQRFGIMPKGTLLRTPALDPRTASCCSWSSRNPDVVRPTKRLQRIGLGVPDVLRR
jgi:4-hydroxyphenylpyruvate dioxygenase